MTTGTIKYSQEGSLTGGGQTTTTGTGAGKPAGPAPAPAGPNFSSVSGAQQQVAPNGQVLSSTNMSVPAPNFSSINGQEVYVPPSLRSAAPTNPIPTGTYRAATTGEALWATPAGEFASGLKAGFTGTQDPNGRSPESMSNSQQAGTLVGALGNIAAGSEVGAEALAKGFESVLGKALSFGDALGNAGKAKVPTLIGTIPTSVEAATSAERIPANTVSEKTITNWVTKNILSTTETITRVAPDGTAKTYTIIKEKAFPTTTVVTAALAYLSSVGFAKWLGRSENPQGVTMAANKLLSEARYAKDPATAQAMIEKANEGLLLADAMANGDMLTQILDWAPAVGIINRASQAGRGVSYLVGAYQMISEDTKAQLDNPSLTDSQIYDARQAQRTQEQEQQRKTDDEYYKQVAEQQAAAKAAGRAEDEAYWKKINDDRAATDAKRKNDEEAYWSAYYKHLDDLRKPQPAAYSKLNFGLLK